jgi:hypothetical protein
MEGYNSILVTRQMERCWDFRLRTFNHSDSLQITKELFQNDTPETDAKLMKFLKEDSQILSGKQTFNENLVRNVGEFQMEGYNSILVTRIVEQIWDCRLCFEG